MAYGNCGSGLNRCGVLWVLRAGGWVSIMPWDLDALIVG